MRFVCAFFVVLLLFRVAVFFRSHSRLMHAYRTLAVLACDLVDSSQDGLARQMAKVSLTAPFLVRLVHRLFFFLRCLFSKSRRLEFICFGYKTCTLEGV